MGCETLRGKKKVVKLEWLGLGGMECRRGRRGGRCSPGVAGDWNSGMYLSLFISVSLLRPSFCASLFRKLYLLKVKKSLS